MPSLLIIPESRKRPPTGSLLYKQIVRFLEEEGIIDKFEIVFLSIDKGIIVNKNQHKLKHESIQIKLPPQRFSSGRLWIKKKEIEEMAESVIEYLSRNRDQYDKIIAYVRGSYLETVRLASKNPGIEIKEIFTEKELVKLKKKGIRWMKVGLRMPEAFQIFERRIRELIEKNEDEQLKLF